jgi:hypothetical protein
MKLKNSDGSVVWNKRYGGALTESGEAIATLNTGTEDEIYVAGWLTNSSNIDAFVMKLDKDGIPVWKRQYGGSGTEKALAIALSDTYVYVTGYETSDHTAQFPPNIFGSNPHSAGKNVFVMKLQQDDGSYGSEGWKKQYGGSGDDEGRSLTMSNSGILISGIENSATNTNDLFVLHINQDGSPIWQNIAGGPDDEWASSMVIDNTGQVYLTGSENSDIDGGGNSSDILLMKFFSELTTSNITGGTFAWFTNGADISWTTNGSNITAAGWAGNDVSGWTSANWGASNAFITTWTMEGETIDNEIINWPPEPPVVW